MERSITQKQIAEKLGVSRQLVGFALGGGGTISEETRQQIKLAAHDLGYRPNGMAKVMKSGKFGAVGLILSSRDHHAYLPDELISGIHDELNRHNLHLCVASLPDEKLTDEDFVPKILREWMIDGLLLDYLHHIPSGLAQIIEKHDIPSVWLNYKGEHDCVHPDDENGTLTATQYLQSLGHRRIAYLDNLDKFHYSAVDRCQGYERAMHEAGLTPQILSFGYMEFEKIPQQARLQPYLDLLSQADRPTAFVGYETYQLTPLFFAATQLGLRVPQDLSLVTTHANAVSVAFLNMATSLIPFYELGQIGVQQLVRKIEKPTLRLRARSVPFRFTPGESCAPPAR